MASSNQPEITDEEVGFMSGLAWALCIYMEPGKGKDFFEELGRGAFMCSLDKLYEEARKLRSEARREFTVKGWLKDHHS